MNRGETQALISMGMAMYPAMYATPAQIAGIIEVWMEAMKEVSASDARAAFTATSRCSPDRFPSLPKVLETLDAMRRNRPDPEKEFRDTHGGKSREEWERLSAWENSEEGKAKLAEYKRRIREIFGKKSA